MRGKTIWFVLVALVAAVALSSVATAASTGPTAADTTRMVSLEVDVLGELNAIRREHGLVPLKISKTLSNAANEHSLQMGLEGYFKHESGDGSAFWKRVERFYPSKGRKLWSVGENLLWSSPDVDGAGALKLWMDSPEHRANILTAKWREIGISAIHVPAAPGTYSGLDVTIVTTDFGVRH